MDSGSHFINNPGESSFALLGAKNFLFVGAAVVADKIKNDINWRMWTAVAAIAVPAMGYVSWSHSSMIDHINLKLEPISILVAENTHARKQGGRYTKLMSIEDKVEHRALHQHEHEERTRILEKVDHLNTTIVRKSHFTDTGQKIDKRLLRLEERVFK